MLCVNCIPSIPSFSRFWSDQQNLHAEENRSNQFLHLSPLSAPAHPYFFMHYSYLCIVKCSILHWKIIFFLLFFDNNLMRQVVTRRWKLITLPPGMLRGYYSNSCRQRASRYRLLNSQVFKQEYEINMTGSCLCDCRCRFINLLLLTEVYFQLVDLYSSNTLQSDCTLSEGADCAELSSDAAAGEALHPRVAR